MVTATNVEATAVNTIAWLSRPETTIVVPVYQRQYRWDIGGCEQLLGDIRAVADSRDAHTHFIGSILSTGASADERSAHGSELVLIDGQQRITTLMLLIAALHHTVAGHDDALAEELARVLVRASPAGGSDAGADAAAATATATARIGRTKLRPHRAWADVFESVVLDRLGADERVRDSRFDDNYAFFRSQVRASEVPRIWRGLQKLEHVAITLGADANAQQIFESLNSTGAPLLDHELIHNYVLMGLSHAEQTEIEESFWLPIEQNTGDSIAAFWRHYLVMKTGREVAAGGGREVYDAFRQVFPRLELGSLREQAAEWRDHSAAYRVLLEPELEPDPEVAHELRGLAVFGKGTYPLVMPAYLEYSRASAERASLVLLVRQVQSLLLRRTVVGIGTARLVARLCRARAEGGDALVRAIARITPSDERVKVALKFSELPHAAYVLGRIAGAGADPAEPLDLEWIVPAAPSDDWSGDGERRFADYSDDEQNSHRALSGTLGNLTLLERGLAERAFDLSYPEKRALYASSTVPLTAQLAGTPAWGTAAIAERTVQLSERFLEVWPRPLPAAGRGYIDDDDLTPVLDAIRRRGWPRGWEREWDYVEYRGEHWEVYDVKYLFNRVFKRLWADSRESVVSFSARRGGPVYEAEAWNGQWDRLDDEHHLYMGWDSQYMLTAVQGVLEEAGLASEVFVKYSYFGAVM
ncbi:DUF262 domain-containing HNH endonuclease family protein [Herbiconiux sp. CPCC 203407]|uniref:DUF262 domain-containing HNH endonuclease family protein n=1 Tax=Herbiconiux oxytropis TaxID=2970915 RepID=A0AA41XCM5_9MICO|nr:DUF262 domain-containing protein [Herbiconiux oxytropis]MCS5722145.1 DUF262 domain-containing HNH endonuclease family protein [Herbiconiux oxytropis]MCS5725727.1 DUF262 domain-containing HNH endonuclease family protein [Herbiconiux oxytropis]